MKGILIAIEGCDGSGKKTQAGLLLERLKKEGRPVVLIAFPRYQEFFGSLVKQYLQGKFGSLEEVRPEFASLLYSLDRYDAMPFIEEQLDEGRIVLCDRYIASNLAHQAAKFKGSEQEGFIRWVESVESRLPPPNATVFLDLPVEVSARLMASRREKDIHEVNRPHLEAARRVYLKLSEAGNWVRVECGSGKGIRSRESIHEEIWEKLSKFI